MGASNQLEDLKDKLRDLEVRNKEHFGASTCISEVRHEDGSWQLLRMDGTEAGRVEPKTCSQKSAAEVSQDIEKVWKERGVDQCVVDVTLVEEGANGDVLQFHRLNGEIASLPLPARARVGSKEEQPPAFPQTVLPQKHVGREAAWPSLQWPGSSMRVSETGNAGLRDAGGYGLPVLPVRRVSSAIGDPRYPSQHESTDRKSLLNDVRSTMYSPSPMGMLGALPKRLPEIRTGGAVVIPELDCDDALHSAVWRDIKTLATQHFGMWDSAITLQSAHALQQLLNAVVVRLQAIRDGGDCIIGRLCMAVLVLLAGEAGQSLRSIPHLHTPLIKMVVEIPWDAIMQSGWPLFGILAQLHLHSHGHDDLPAAGSEAVYYSALRQALQHQQHSMLAGLGAAFLEQGRSNSASADIALGDSSGEAHAMPALSALASQLLKSDSALGGIDRRHMQQVQGLYREVVQSIDDLHATVISAWPLYCILHGASIQLRSAGLDQPR